jgi:hypothetical protein
LRFVGIADDPGDARKSGELFGSALGIAASDNKADGGVGGVKFANGVAGLGIGGGGDSAGIDDDDVGGSGRGGGSAAAVEQLALDGSTISLRGAATELFDEERRHLRARRKKKRKNLHTVRGIHRERREKRIHAVANANDTRIAGLRKGEKSDSNQGCE